MPSTWALLLKRFYTGHHPPEDTSGTEKGPMPYGWIQTEVADWLFLRATLLVVPSPAHPSWVPGFSWSPYWHGTLLCPLCSARGETETVLHYCQCTKLWITPLFHMREASKCSAPHLWCSQPRTSFIVHGELRLHTITEQPCKTTGPANTDFLPGSFLWFILFTTTETSMFFSTFWLPRITDIK